MADLTYPTMCFLLHPPANLYISLAGLGNMAGELANTAGGKGNTEVG